MKFNRLLLENTITPIHKKVLRAMTLDLGETDDVAEIWGFLTDTLDIEDLNLKMELLHLFMNHFNEDGNYSALTDVDFDGMEDISIYSEPHLALASWLNLPPVLIEEADYSHYDLVVYKDLVNDDEYAVGEDSDVEKAMEMYYDGFVDNIGGLDNIDRWTLEDFIEIDDYAVGSLAREEAEHIVDSLDDDEILERAGYSREELEDAKTYNEDKIDELDDEIYELESELDDLESDNEDGELDSEIDDLRGRIEQLNRDKESLADKVTDLESELDDLLDTAKEELLEKIEEEIANNIESSGLDYFTDELQYPLSDAVRYFYSFNEAGLERYLAENADRGNDLASYDGVENEEKYNDTYYYIYQIN